MDRMPPAQDLLRRLGLLGLGMTVAAHCYVLYAPHPPGEPLFPHSDKVIHALPHGRELTLGFERVKSYVAAKCAQEDVPVSCEMAVREHRLPDIERISQ